MALRVLTISKPYVAAAYRNKLAALAASGRFEIGLVCPPAWAGQRYERPESPEPFTTTIVPIVFDGRNHFHLYRGLEAAVRAFRPDVLNVEEEHYSLVTLQAFRIARKVGAQPIFYTWQNIAKRYPPPFSWVEQSIFSQAAAGVGGNAESIAILRTKGFRGEAREIPQMGVELERFAPTDSSQAARDAKKRVLALDDSALLVGFFGRLVEEKGVQDLLRAIAALAAQPGARRPVSALVVGSGPHEAALRALAAELGIERRVTFLRQVPSQAVAAYLQAVDALCLPSLTRANWKEQFGRVLVEAMAAEAVLVGSSSGEIPNVIGDAGLVFAESDARALTVTLARLRDEPELMLGLRERGARRVRERFTNAIVADRFGDLFETVVSRKTR